MDKSNWSLIFERPNRREREGERKREKKRKRKRRRREEEVKPKSKRYGFYDFCMELGIDLNRYMFVGCGL